jgi:tetratricopeptide (TPR) repeat protein
MRYFKIVRILAIAFCFNISTVSLISLYASSYNMSNSVELNELVRSADMEHQDAQRKSAHINTLYMKGKSSYNAKNYLQAKKSFEDILEIEPSYKPAILFMESVVILEGISESQKRIEDIKTQMADIMSEYDKRVQRFDMLAAKYFLELAQKECQVGNFQAAEKHYNLCYKIHPQSKDKIEWFVMATHDLMVLYNKLDEENAKIEEFKVSVR